MRLRVCDAHRLARLLTIKDEDRLDVGVGVAHELLRIAHLRLGVDGEVDVEVELQRRVRLDDVLPYGPAALRQRSHRARDDHSDHRPRGARGRAASVDEAEYHEHRADEAGPRPLHCAGRSAAQDPVSQAHRRHARALRSLADARFLPPLLTTRVQAARENDRQFIFGFGGCIETDRTFYFNQAKYASKIFSYGA